MYGFSCKTISKANSSTAGIKYSVLQMKEMTGTTATTFWAGIDYIILHKPALVFLENVDALLHDADGEDTQTDRTIDRHTTRHS